TVMFTPRDRGMRQAILEVIDGAADAPHRALLKGLSEASRARTQSDGRPEPTPTPTPPPQVHAATPQPGRGYAVEYLGHLDREDNLAGPAGAVGINNVGLV